MYSGAWFNLGEILVMYQSNTYRDQEYGDTLLEASLGSEGGNTQNWWAHFAVLRCRITTYTIFVKIAGRKNVCILCHAVPHLNL